MHHRARILSSKGYWIVGLLLVGIIAGAWWIRTSGADEASPQVANAATNSALRLAESSTRGIQRANAPPRIDDVRFEPPQPRTGDNVRAVVDASDREDDGLWLSYAWSVDGRAVGGDSARLDLTGAAKNDRIEVRVVASDGKSKSHPFVARTDVENSPPELRRVEVEPSGDVTAGTGLVVRPEARDADGDALSFSYEWRVGSRVLAEQGPVLDTHGLLRGSDIHLTVLALDEQGESEPLEIVAARIVNAAPEIVSQPEVALTDGVFRYQVRARDADGDAGLRFSLAEAPSGMTIHPYRGLLRWQPGAGQSGAHSVKVLVQDSEGAGVTQSFGLQLDDPTEGGEGEGGSGQ